MAFLESTIYSHTLEREVSVNIILPHATKQFGEADALERVPVLYLLHGLTENHSTWCRKSSIERYVTGKRLAVVMPDGGRSFYNDTPSGVKWFTFLTDELPALMHRMLPISDKREDTYIAGLSMGGYGAFKAALSRPERYSCAASLSGAMDIGTVISMGQGMTEVASTLGAEPTAQTDLFELLKACADIPALYQACGTEDFLYSDNLRFKAAAEAKAADYTYSELPGYEHEWRFWDMQIEKVVDWLAEHNESITAEE